MAWKSSNHVASRSARASKRTLRPWRTHGAVKPRGHTKWKPVLLADHLNNATLLQGNSCHKNCTQRPMPSSRQGTNCGIGQTAGNKPASISPNCPSNTPRIWGVPLKRLASSCRPFQNPTKTGHFEKDLHPATVNRSRAEEPKAILEAAVQPLVPDVP